MGKELIIENNVVKGPKDKTCPTTINIPQNVTGIAPEAFANCVDLEKVVLPDSLVSIGKFAFFNCKNLESVTFSSGIKAIGRSAFQNCEALKSVELHYGIDKIEPWTFAGCKSLETVSLPNGVKYIGHQAFADCIKLKHFDTLSSELFYENALGYDVFQNMNVDCKVTVPLYFDKEYQQTPQWNAFDIKVNEKKIFSFNGLKYREVEEGKTVAVAENKSFVGHADIKSEIQFGELTLTVCEIDREAFCENNLLTSVHIPNTVKAIGEKAFTDCSKLAYFTSDSVSDSDCVYEAVNGVLFKKTEESRDTLVAYPAGNDREVYAIPATVKKIEDYAFSSIRSLLKITFPNKAYEMQETLVFDKAMLGKCYAFVLADAENLQKSLKELGFMSIISDSFVSNGLNYKILNEGNKTVEVSLNQSAVGDLRIPGTVEFASEKYQVAGIGNNAFSNAKLTSITFPDTIIDIGMEAFASVSLQKPISSLPGSLESIGASAFDSPKITFANFKLPSKLKEIGSYAFLRCQIEEKTVQIPAKVSLVGCEAFGAVKMIEVDKANESYKSEGGVLLSKNGDTLIAYPKENPATSFIIPDGVKTIGRNAFDNCKNLDTITIPKSVEDIQACVFRNISLKQLIVKVTVPPTLHPSAWTDFDATESFFVQVPEGHVEDYKDADGWKQFAKRIYDKIPEMLLEGNINYKVDINNKNAVVVDGTQASGDITIVKELSSYGFTFKVVGIGTKAFWNNKAVTSLSLPDTITEIQEQAFEGATMSRIVVDSKNKSYCADNNALFDIKKTKLYYYFSGKPLCSEYKVPEGVKEISSSAFQEAKITHLHLPSTLTTFGSTPFGNMEHGNSEIKVVSIDATKAPKVMESDAFTYMNFDCVFVVPKGYKTEYQGKDGWKQVAARIFEPAFEANNINYEIESFVDKTVQVVKSPQAQGDIVINDQVEYCGLSFKVDTIGAEAFGDNKNLVSVVLPETITFIGDKAFKVPSSSKWKEIRINAMDPPQLGKDVFAGILSSSAIVMVPKGRVGSYKVSNGWKQYAERIMDEYPRDFSEGGINYSILDFDAKTVEVGQNTNIRGDIVIQSTVKHDGITYNVIGIGNSAFKSNHNITSIKLPSTIKTIGDGAFMTLEITITLPESLEKIGASAFAFDRFDELRLPSGVKEIGYTAFAKTSVKSGKVTIPSSVNVIKGNSFDSSDIREIDVDDNNNNYKSVDGVLFSKDEKKLITYPQAKGDAFCTIPTGVTTIGENSFGNDYLTQLIIPTTVSKLEDCALWSCRSLRILEVQPTTPPMLGDESLKGVPTDCIIIVPQGCVQDYKKAAGWKEFPNIMDEMPSTFVHNGINYKVLSFIDKTADVGENPEATGSITILSQVTNNGVTYDVIGIGDNAFNDNQKIETIYLPASIKTIGVNAFCNSGISKFNVDIKNNFYKTEDDVLFSKEGKKLIAYPCQKKEKNYTIPSAVSTIGEGAFSTCRVTKLTIKTKTPPVVENNGLAGLLETCIEVTVPQGCTNVYKNASGWKDLAKKTKIKEQ